MPIQLEITFAFQHPLSHYRGLSYQLKPEHQSALQTHVPDIDKLARAVLDALTGIVYEDDAQVASLVATKIYDSLDSTVICIRDLTPEGLWDAAETTDALPMGNGTQPSSGEG
jgi:Holliday junction resolvase RusA-like endonuclease